MTEIEQTFCDRCSAELEVGQVGLCDDCIDDDGNDDASDLAVADTHGMRCPICGDDRQLEVVAQIWVRLVEDGTEDSDDGDQEYDDDSAARCLACDWRGTVGDLRRADTLARILDYAQRVWSWDDAAMLTELMEDYDDNETPEAFVDRYAAKFDLTRTADVVPTTTQGEQP